MSASELPWRAIASGATFEWLVAVLVFLEDPNAKLFGRPGRDGGQDAKSGDGSTVYQAKFHARGTAADAINDAKKEAAAIKRYRTPTHSRAAQWASVNQWVLATNVPFNPTDDSKWRNEVEPVFKSLGITARYWGQREVEAKVIVHPEVRDSFFGGHTRVFISLPEARLRLIEEEPFANRNDLLELHGRSSVITEINEFIHSDRRFLLLHGEGGVGKTRLILEAGLVAAEAGDMIVLWANIASMEASSGWLTGVPQGRDVLLLIDEPESDEIMKILVEQMTPMSAPMARWKVIVTVRSPKDPIVRYLRLPKLRSRVSEIRLQKLTLDAAKALCVELLQTGPLNGRLDAEVVGIELARRFGAHPIWMRLAVQVLEQHGDLRRIPQNAEDLADQYIEEIVSGPGTEGQVERQRLLRWVALFGSVNSEDQGAMEVLARRAALPSAGEAKAGLAALARRGALRTRGARNRIFEVKPDVLRDHVLTRWLTVDVGVDGPRLELSSETRLLIGELSAVAQDASMSLAQRTMLTSLARTDFVLRVSGRPVEIIAEILADIKRAIPSMSASARLFCGELLAELGEAAPGPTLSLARILRQTPVEPEQIITIFQMRNVGKDEVLLALAWGVFHAAMGADNPVLRREIFDELCALVRAEADAEPRLPRGLPNDGRRATALVKRAIGGGRSFWGSYREAALAQARSLLSDLGHNEPDRGTKALLNALVMPMTAVERREEWVEERVFHIQNYVILPGDDRWSEREKLLTIIRSLLESESTPLAARIALWETFAEAHSSASRAENDLADDVGAPLREAVTAGLRWTLTTLNSRSFSLNELRAAREVWHWHARFEKDPTRMKMAQEMEELFERNDLAREFEPLTSYDRWETHDAAAEEKAQALVHAGPMEIEAFVQRAITFIGENEFYRVLPVASKIGSICDDSLVGFAKSALSGTRVTPLVQFATIILVTWLRDLRAGPNSDSAPGEARAVIASSGSDTIALHVLWRLYCKAPPPLGYTNIREEEVMDVRKKVDFFLNQNHAHSFLEAITWGLRYDWDGYRALAEFVLNSIPRDHIGHTVAYLVKAVYWLVELSCSDKRSEYDPRPLPEGLGEWLLDQLPRVPDLDRQRSVNWHMEKILETTGRPDLTWLARATRRMSEYGSLPPHNRLSRYVVPLNSESALKPELRQAVSELIDLTHTGQAIGYSLPQHLYDIDPDGLVVPDLVTERIVGAQGNPDALWRLSRLAGPWNNESAAWRMIARAAIVASGGLSDKDRDNILYALANRSPRGFSVSPGEIPSHVVSAVEHFRERRMREVDKVFIPFWDYQLVAAEEELAPVTERPNWGQMA